MLDIKVIRRVATAVMGGLLLVLAACATTPATENTGIGPHGKKLYHFMVFSDATPGMEEEFNRWYDRIHAPIMIESGDFISAQRFAYSPVQLGGAELPKRGYMVLFTIETDDIERVKADTDRRMRLPRNVRSEAMNYRSLLSYTFEALGPAINQSQAQRLIAEETAAGRVPPLDAAPASDK